ncbi:undecaprenyl-diphosphate phosphatase [Candidatus Pelagibacter sp.]|nr:undecaprenyl-diphosphate phosphatase [Candidatus Pelagibacter sp.]|tara:strand:- start:153 stop:920 length:768 start_codon:yes stop_codon:yes gene_type:complete
MLSNLIEIGILSLIQGISEFLPISSSAHLIVISTLYDFKSSSLLMDVSLHLGSLFAIIFYFKKDILNFQNNKKLLTLILIGSFPIMIIGYFLYSTELIYLLRDIKIIAWTTLVFGIILYIADKNSFKKNIQSDLNIKTILYIGFFQTLALIPGVSRAGITITAGRILKFNRYDSSKISFLLSIPALTGASLLSLRELLQTSFEFNYLILIATTLSFLFSYFTVKFFLDYINKFSLNIFVIYRIIVGLILFIIVYN